MRTYTSTYGLAKRYGTMQKRRPLKKFQKPFLEYRAYSFRSDTTSGNLNGSKYLFNSIYPQQATISIVACYFYIGSEYGHLILFKFVLFMESQTIFLKDVMSCLESKAPLSLQESYDNSGLIIGNKEDKINATLLSLDCTEDVIDEAIEKKCNLIISHHPIIFSGIKKLTSSTYIERTIEKAIRNRISLYACHTNLDNTKWGVNRKIAEKIGLKNLRILMPQKGALCKLYTYVPRTHYEMVLEALFAHGAGHIGEYSECSFSTEGRGTFKPSDNSRPFTGIREARHEGQEVKVEVLIPCHLEKTILQALIDVHPYEEVAYELIRLENPNQDTGSGMIGTLEESMSPKRFLEHLKIVFQCDCIRYTDFEKSIQEVALCGGSGSFLLPAALARGAEAFVTADFKYHQFFDADQKLMIADIGHFESEQYTPQLIYDILIEKFPTFALHLSEVRTNPVHYYK